MIIGRKWVPGTRCKIPRCRRIRYEDERQSQDPDIGDTRPSFEPVSCWVRSSRF